MHDAALERITRLEHTVHQQLGGAGRCGVIESWQQATAARIDELESQLHGDASGFGLRTRVLILWHSYGWVIGLAGAIVGAALTRLFGG